jgi:hypothetical protein
MIQCMIQSLRQCHASLLDSLLFCIGLACRAFMCISDLTLSLTDRRATISQNTTVIRYQEQDYHRVDFVADGLALPRYPSELDSLHLLPRVQSSPPAPLDQTHFATINHINAYLYLVNQIPWMILIQKSNLGLPTNKILYKCNKNLKPFLPFPDITKIIRFSCMKHTWHRAGPCLERACQKTCVPGTARFVGRSNVRYDRVARVARIGTQAIFCNIFNVTYR